MESRMDQYEIMEQIGRGAFGAAILVNHKQEKKKYVLKKIRLARQTERCRRSAHQEMAIIAPLQHPFIVEFKEAWVEKGCYVCIVTGYCEGGDMAELMRKSNGVYFPEEKLLNWFAQLLLAVEYLHSNYVLHRDLKCSNIFLTRDQDVRLGDFGLAKTLKADDLTSSVVGTPNYMCPELLADIPYGFKSDIWSLGCCMYEMAAHRPAFKAFDMAGLISKINRSCIGPVPPCYSPSLKSLIKSMLRKNPEHRPNASEVLRNPYLQPHVNQNRPFLDHSNASPSPEKPFFSPISDGQCSSTDWEASHSTDGSFLDRETVPRHKSSERNLVTVKSTAISPREEEGRAIESGQAPAIKPSSKLGLKKVSEDEISVSKMRRRHPLTAPRKAATSPTKKSFGSRGLPPRMNREGDNPSSIELNLSAQNQEGDYSSTKSHERNLMDMQRSATAASNEEVSSSSAMEPSVIGSEQEFVCKDDDAFVNMAEQKPPYMQTKDDDYAVKELLSASPLEKQGTHLTPAFDDVIHVIRHSSFRVSAGEQALIESSGGEAMAVAKDEESPSKGAMDVRSFRQRAEALEGLLELSAELLRHNRLEELAVVLRPFGKDSKVSPRETAIWLAKSFKGMMMEDGGRCST